MEILDADEQVLWTSDTINPVAEGESPASPGDLLTLTPPDPVVGCGVRISKHAVNGADSSEWMSLAEVQVMATPAAPYDALIATDVGAQMAGQSAEAWLEIPFSAQGGPWDRATLAVRHDDGFSAWLGDEPVASANAGDGVASAAHDAEPAERYTLEPGLLGDDEGLLTVQGLNLTADDDFFLGVELTLQQIKTGAVAWFDEPTPAEPNGEGFTGFAATPQVSASRGFYRVVVPPSPGGPTHGGTRHAVRGPIR